MHAAKRETALFIVTNLPNQDQTSPLPSPRGILTSGPQHVRPRFLQSPPLKLVGSTNDSSQRTWRDDMQDMPCMEVKSMQACRNLIGV